MDHLLWYWSRFQQAFAIDVYLRQKIKSSQRSNLEARIFSTGSIAVSGQKFDPSPIVPWRHPQDCQMRSLQGQQRAPAAPMADGRCLIHIWKLKPLKLVWLQVLLGGEMELLRWIGCWMGFFRFLGMLCGWFRGMFFPWYCLVMICFSFNVIATFKICCCVFNLFTRLTFLSHTEKNLCQPLGLKKKLVPIAFPPAI